MSIVPDFEYDIFISYRHNDNLDGWVSDFVQNLEKELRATIKEPLTIYFDKNPRDGLLETHDVNGSLKAKLKCLIFIPVISRTYCDVKSFAWNQEFLEFLKTSSTDSLGLKTKLPNGNLASRVLQVRIHELDAPDKQSIEEALQGPLRAIDFTYQAAGVNRPLRLKDDESIKGTSQASYRDQINKTANAISDLIAGMQGKNQKDISVKKETRQTFTSQSGKNKKISIPGFQLSTWIILALSTVLVVISFLHFSEKTQETSTYKVSILSPDKTNFNLGTLGGFALSPDGRQVAFVARDSSSMAYLWVRSLNNLNAQKLKETEGAYLPFWSPDSRFIGFFTNAKLKKVDASGGPVQSICNVSVGRGGTWNSEDMIIFNGEVIGALSRVSASGGKPVSLTSLDTMLNETSHRWPTFLPDGNHFLYTSRKNLSVAGEEDAIMLATLDSSATPRIITRASSNAEYSHEHIFFVRNQTLMAQAFSLVSYETQGDPSTIAENIYYEGTTFYSTFSTTKNGNLAYQTLPPNPGNNSLIWHDRQGKKLGSLTLGSGPYSSIRLSPDGQRVAFSYADVQTSNQDIWIYDFSKKISSRFTFDKAIDRAPVWCPDGRHIIFSSDRNKGWNLYQHNSDGSGTEELVMASSAEYLTDWSADGKYLAAWTVSKNSGNDTWIHTINHDGERVKPFPFLNSEFGEDQATFSPDRRWIAYRSGESGKSEIYIRPFPGPGGKWQVSASGGRRPRWRGDGKELFFLSNDFKITSAEIRLGASNIEIGVIKPLFGIPPIPASSARDVYDVSPDGQKIIVEYVLIYDSATPITLVVNWPGENKKK